MLERIDYLDENLGWKTNWLEVRNGKRVMSRGAYVGKMTPNRLEAELKDRAALFDAFYRENY